MADADTRYKRASATAFLLPFMYTCHTDGVEGVSSSERVHTTWMYMGIDIGLPVVTGWENVVIEGVDIITGNYFHIIGRKKTR